MNEPLSTELSSGLRSSRSRDELLAVASIPRDRNYKSQSFLVNPYLRIKTNQEVNLGKSQSTPSNAPQKNIDTVTANEIDSFKYTVSKKGTKKKVYCSKSLVEKLVCKKIH